MNTFESNISVQGFRGDFPYGTVSYRPHSNWFQVISIPEHMTAFHFTVSSHKVSVCYFNVNSGAPLGPYTDNRSGIEVDGKTSYTSALN